MSDAVQNDNARNNPPAPKSDSSKIVLLLVIAGIIAVAAYQFFSCENCYSSLPL